MSFLEHHSVFNRSQLNISNPSTEIQCNINPVSSSTKQAGRKWQQGYRVSTCQLQRLKQTLQASLFYYQCSFQLLNILRRIVFLLQTIHVFDVFYGFWPRFEDDPCMTSFLSRHFQKVGSWCNVHSRSRWEDTLSDLPLFAVATQECLSHVQGNQIGIAILNGDGVWGNL